MVFISRPIISERTYVGLIRLVEIALVRSTYARWCGGTAVKAASYPIRKLDSAKITDSRGVAFSKAEIHGLGSIPAGVVSGSKSMVSINM